MEECIGGEEQVLEEDEHLLVMRRRSPNRRCKMKIGIGTF
jgi:hypothetical protein